MMHRDSTEKRLNSSWSSLVSRKTLLYHGNKVYSYISCFFSLGNEHNIMQISARRCSCGKCILYRIIYYVLKRKTMVSINDKLEEENENSSDKNQH